jgi:exonuclease SbcC
MRPGRLELEGFTAYRELTVCDFEGADLFVLTGPTGSGKSSLIDAMTFALYGSVPRYDNPNLVHPVISQGKLEAKVRFDFSVEGQRYTAVRVVRRTKGGATTREARLESDGRTLAGSADELTEKVRSIIGLNFEQFITCVVLPQGDFARFLHERPAERQDLLTRLLGVDVYERMGTLARIREAEAKQKSRLHQDELDRAAGVTEEARREAQRRTKSLEKLKDEIESAVPELEKLKRRVDEADFEAARWESEKKLLEKLEIPKGAIELAEKIREARTSFQKARLARAEAEASLASLEKRRSEYPHPSELHAIERSYRELAEKHERLRVEEGAAAAARKKLDEHETAKTGAEERAETARSLLARLLRELAAHDLIAHLETGKPCPVCGRTVESVPKAPAPALASAEKALEKAERARAAAITSWQERSREAALTGERARALTAEIAALVKRLEGTLSKEDVAAKLKAASEFEEELSRARSHTEETKSEEGRIEKEIGRLGDQEARALRRFDEFRDALSFLRPPAADRSDVGRAWSELHAWAQAALPKHRDLAAKAVEARVAAEEERELRLSAIESRCRELGVEIERERPRDGVVSAIACARTELERIERTLERSRFLRESIAKETEEASVAGALGQHLKATGFERWLLEESFRRLVEGATVILKELSSGQYSFEYDDRLNFEVVDHRNADERRSARTLSGGETFLASLALALTLADETAQLAAHGSARLESLFLDEGFGTLDDETLEVVGSAIAELGSRGRVVGVVTHQQNLAATIPIQYRVSRNPVTSTVTKVVV